DRHLVECRAAFVRAELTEEIRDDARIYIALIDLLRAFPVSDAAPSIAFEEVRRLAGELEDRVFGPGRAWRGMASHTEEMIEYRILSVARTLNALSDTSSRSAAWTNFDEALTEVAALFLLLVHGEQDTGLPLPDPLSGVAAAV